MANWFLARVQRQFIVGKNSLFQQMVQEQMVGKNSLFQQMVYVHIQKNEVGPLSYTKIN